MTKKSFARLISVLIALMLIVGLMPGATAMAQTEENEGTTVYFLDAYGWDGPFYVNYEEEWDTWYPSIDNPMTYVTENEFGQALYKVTVPADAKGFNIFKFDSFLDEAVKYTRYIQNDVAENTCFYPTDKISSGKWDVDSYIYTDEDNIPIFTLDYTINGECVTITGYTGEETSVVLPETIEGYPVTMIAENAFRDNLSILEIVIPDSVTSIGNSAFCGCTKLRAVTLSENLETIGDYAFSGCKSVKSFVVPDSVELIGEGAFAYCDALENVVLPIGLEQISSGLFQNCDSIEEINIPESVTSIGEFAFYDCDGLKTLTLSSSVESIGMRAFNSCDGLVSAKLSEGLKTIGKMAFDGCTAIEIVNIPQSVTEVGAYAFTGCTKLKNFEYPAGVTTIFVGMYPDRTATSVEVHEGARVIEESAFSYFENLQTVTIPKSVENIKSFAFFYCGSLADVYYGGTERQWNLISIEEKEGTNRYLMNATIHFMGTEDEVIPEVPEEPTPDEVKPEVPEDPTPDEVTPDEPTPDEVTPDEVTPDEATPDEPAFVGDANGDGVVNIKDATEIQKAIAELVTLDELCVALADADGNGSVDVRDATAIQKWLAGIETSFPVGSKK